MATILDDLSDSSGTIDIAPEPIQRRRIRVPALPRATTIIPFRAVQAGKPAAIKTGIFQIR